MLEGRWAARLGATAILASLPAHAQPAVGDRAYSLEYRAHGACPSVAALQSAIRQRSPGASAVRPPAAAVHFTLELAAGGHSELWVDLPEGSFHRQFQAESCAEALASMAVIIAMVLDAAPAERRAMAQFPAVEAAQASGSSIDVSTAAGAVATSEQPPLPPVPDALPRPLPAALPPPVRPPRAVEKVARRSWSALAGGSVESAVAPSAPLGFVAGLEAWLPGAGWWSPSARLSVLSTVTATTHVADGDGKFRLLTARLAACPWRLALVRSLRILPCADFELGSLRAQGGGVAENPAFASMLWAAPGVSLGARLELTQLLGLETAAGAKLLLRRDRFTFRPSSLVYQVPSTSFDLGAAIVVKFL